MRKIDNILPAVIGAFLAINLTWAATILVPDDYGTIQGAIDASTHWDTVLVADGTYIGDGNRDMDFGGRAITVRSENGPDFTVIDCGADSLDQHRGFYFYSGENSFSKVEGFTITNGWTGESNGGGVYCETSSPAVTDCAILGNSAECGGGFFCELSSPVITGCVFSGNSAKFGGGIYCNSSSPIITACTIESNTAEFHAGGISCYNQSCPTITECLITANTAELDVGAIDCIDSDPIFTNCTITENEGGSTGGITCREASSPVIRFCTFAENISTYAGGLLCQDSSPNIENCIFWLNIPAEIIVVGETSPDITFSDIKGGYPGTGNIDENPFFAGAGDYHLSEGSFCIDSGTDGGVYIDIDGDTRPQYDGYDMGSDEYIFTVPDSSVTIHVPGDYATIQEAIDASTHWDTVLVADGIYIGDGNRDIDFGGRAIMVKSENGPDYTIIDCEADSLDQHRGFYFHSGENSFSKLEGFTITNGWTGESNGGGIYCEASSPTITDCVISGNDAECGGGIYCRTSSPTITGCVFSGNSVLFGGGIYCNASSPIITACTIEGNTAEFHAGGIACYYGSCPTITECLITGNTAILDVAAIDCNNSDPIFTNCTITGNAGGAAGGITCRDAASPVIRHCTFAENTSTYAGGLLCQDSSPILANCIFWLNIPVEIIVVGETSPDITFSDIHGGYPGTGNINENPLFAGPVDFHISVGSPCINSGMDAGVYIDIDGDTRPRHGGFDMGSDEFPFSPPDPFLLLFPADQDSIVNPEIVFDWEDTADPDPGDEVSYDLYYDTDSTFSTAVIIYDITESEFAILEMLPVFTRYYWKVKAHDQWDDYTWSDIFSFYTYYPEPFLFLDPESFSFTLPAGAAETDTLLVYNLGNIDIEYTFLWFVDWIDISPVSGTISPGEMDTVEITCSAEGLAPDTYMATVSLVTNTESRFIPVTLDVLPPVTIELNPAQFWIPQGGSLDLEMILDNLSDLPQVFYQQFRVERNDVKVWNTAIDAFSLEPLEQIERYYAFPVPQSTPTGNYTFYGAIGVPGNPGVTIWGQDEFDFEVVGGSLLR